jgi:hypothetical protein
MKNTIVTSALMAWLRGLLIYALITLPALSFPAMYVVSLWLAAIWSLPALLLFGLLLAGLQYAHLPAHRLMLHLLPATAFLITLCTWGAAWQFTDGTAVWKTYLEFLLFPLVGILSGVLAVVVRRKALQMLLCAAANPLQP